MTVHVGGTFDEVARAEAAVRAGRHAEQPFVLVAQPCVVDPTRAPEGKHTLWGYCHVPNGSSVDMSERMEAQIERFAPGFGDLVLARAVRTAAEAESYNPNLLGVTSTAGRPRCARRSSGRSPAGTPTGRRSRGCTSARPPPRRAAACTGCAACGRRSRR